MTRAELIGAFLDRCGEGGAKLAPLAQDASFRRYWRLPGARRPLVLMDAPPPEDVHPFLRIATHLAGAGLSVPTVIAADPAAGLVLLEDFGDALFSGLMENEAGEVLMDAAVDALIAIQRAPPPPDLPAWDGATMAATALSTLLDWWWPAAFGASPPAAARKDFAAALAETLSPLAAAAPVFVHRDYFAGNLIWLAGRAGIRRVGILDFQSAALGHPAYDLASLIEDSRRAVPPELGERAIGRYLAGRPDLDAEGFRAALAVCTAQRHLRVAGQWVRLARRDGKPHYLAHGPHTWRLLTAALRHPAVAPLAAVFDRWVPPAARGNPPGLAA